MLINKVDNGGRHYFKLNIDRSQSMDSYRWLLCWHGR